MHGLSWKFHKKPVMLIPNKFKHQMGAVEVYDFQKRLTTSKKQQFIAANRNQQIEKEN